MRRPWSRESRSGAGWGSLRVVWPLLAMMTWLCKSCRLVALQEASRSVKLTNSLIPNLETHALQIKIQAADSCVFPAAAIWQPVAGLQLDRISEYQAEWIPSLRLLGHEFDQTRAGRLHHAHVAALQTLRLRRAGESL